MRKSGDRANTDMPKRVVLVGTYRTGQLRNWRGWYNWPLTSKDKITEADAAKITELWLFQGTKAQRNYKAEFVGVKTREELIRDYGYPGGVATASSLSHDGGDAIATSAGARVPRDRPHATHYALFKTEFKYRHKLDNPLDCERVIVRTADFATAPKVRKQLKAYLESPDRNDPDLAKCLPEIITKLRPEQLRVCEVAVQLSFWDLPQMRPVLKMKNNERIIHQERNVCAPIAEYSRAAAAQLRDTAATGGSQSSATAEPPIRVVELFAGVGGFRIGLERASNRFETIWNNQWEPATKRQDASIVYQSRFGIAGHSNNDISTVPVSQIPQADLLVGGFPCQDYSVATTLKNSGGIEGKKGVLWWQIHRILRDSANPPPYLFLENVDRLLKSPASQRGRDFAIILASLSDLGYAVEWRVINAADYGMPQRRRRTYIVAYRKNTQLFKDAKARTGGTRARASAESPCAGGTRSRASAESPCAGGTRSRASTA